MTGRRVGDMNLGGPEADSHCVPSEKIHSSPKEQDLRVWLYLEVGSL